MTPEAEFLLAILRNPDTPAPATLGWPAFLQLAESHGLVRLFADRFPEKLPEEFAAWARDQWAASASLTGELKGLLGELAGEGIEVIPLKGPLLATLLYGSPTRRISDDLDLLVRPEDMPAAEALLVKLGFRSAYPADDYHHSFARAGTRVELHFAIGPPSNPSLDLRTAWARAITVEFQGQKTRFFAPPDLLLYLVIHLVKHDFGRLIWLLDTSLALKQMSDDELNEAVAMARNIGVEGAFFTTCALIESVFWQPLPLPIAAEVARKPVITAQAEVLLQRVLAAPAHATTARHGTEIFIQLESGFGARWKQRMRTLKPSHQDYAWARSHHLHPQLMILLRPLRLLKAYGPGAAWRVLFPRSCPSSLRA